jgi:Ca-activated chloride channel family protein
MDRAMTIRRAAHTAVVGGLAALSFAGSQIYRSGVDTVHLSVTVTDSKNHPITGLDKADFQVFEDGLPQEIAIFTRDPQPIALSLLIDSSTSMEEKLAVAQEAATGFAHRLGKNDVAQVIDFNNDTQIRQPFTNDTHALERAIRGIRAGGSTSLYTALYVAISELTRAHEQASEEIRRQAIVVLSDGEDTTSLKTYEDVLELARLSDVAIYAIGLRDKEPSQTRRFSQSDFALRSLSQVTGGRLYFVEDVRQLASIYGQIADELANQYFIGYNAKNLKRDGGWRQIALRVTRPDTAVRTRAGYVAPSKGH